MSTKTLLKRISLIAVVALGTATLSVTSASAVINTVTSSNPTATVVNGAPASTTVCFNGINSPADVATFSVTGPAAASSSASWSVANTANPPLVFSATSGSATAATPGSFTATKSNGSNQCILISVSTTGAASLNQVVVTETVTSTVVLTVTVNTSTTSSDVPWRAIVTAPDTTVDTTPSAITVANVITSASDVTVLRSNSDTVTKAGTGSYRYLEVTGSTIAAVATAAGSSAMTLNGLVNAATQAAMPQDGKILNNEVWINTATAGTVTVKFYDRTQDSVTGYATVTLLQTVTITTAAAKALDASKSTSVINANSLQLTALKAASSNGGHLVDLFAADETIVAAKAVNGTSTTTDAVAVIKVVLKDSTGTAIVNSPSNPKIGARVEGATPGTVSISYTPAGASLTGTAGRNVSVATPTFVTAGTFYINVFSDGNGGKSTVSVMINDAVWTTETLSFYGAVTKVTATQGLYVLPAGTTAGGTYGCALGLGCLGTSVALSPAVSLAATDADGIAVPYLTYTATSSDATVLTGVATASPGIQNVPYAGVNHFQVTVPYLAAAGKSAALSYTTGTVTSNPLTFALGGAAASVSIALSGLTEVGALNAITITAKDAAGNKAYDADHTAILTSNVVINTAVNATQAIFTAGGVSVPVWNGAGSVKFYNPIVPTTLVIGGTIGGAAVSATAVVNNAAVDAAADAAAEAIDAANAATDAANLAAEAADAATVAAEEARDAADAATAAVEALATEVSALIAALKAQLTTLANTVAKMVKAQAKIAKKLNVKL